MWNVVGMNSKHYTTLVDKAAVPPDISQKIMQEQEGTKAAKAVTSI